MKVFSIGGLILAAIFWLPSLLFSSQILSLFGVEAGIIAQGVGNFRLFYSEDPGKPLASTSVDRVFGRFWNATAFAPECSDKPVVHDLRFGFITDRVNRWALDGVDVEAMMPYLNIAINILRQPIDAFG